MSELLLDAPAAAGRRRPAGLPHRPVRRATRACATRPIHRRSRRSSPSCAPPAIGPTGAGCAALIVILWRAGLRINEALALSEGDLDPGRGSLLVRRGKGGRRREVGMDAGPGSNCSRGSSSDASCPSGRCSVSSPERHPRPHTGHAAACEPSSAAPPQRPEFGAASRRTSCATPTRSRWLTKACR